MTINHQEAMLTAGDIKEQQQRRELYETLVTDCDFPELLAETVAVLAAKHNLPEIMCYARRGAGFSVLYHFNNWRELVHLTGIDGDYWYELCFEVDDRTRQQNKNIPNKRPQGVDTPDHT